MSHDRDMSRVLPPDELESVVATLRGGASPADDGPTPEQEAVIGALAAGYFGVPAADGAETLEPSEAAAVFTDEREQRRVRELLIAVEFARHPLTDAQVARTDSYLEALDAPADSNDVSRGLVRGGVDLALLRYSRRVPGAAAAAAEPSMAERYLGSLDAPDPELAARLRALADLGPGTLGRAYVEFHDRAGIKLPGDDLSFPALFVSHDMNHVIGGYDASPLGELCIQSMSVAVSDTDAHWIGLLGALLAYEGLGTSLAAPGAPEALARAWARGAACTGDFTSTDHLSMAGDQLEDVRARFGVPPLG